MDFGPQCRWCSWWKGGKREGGPGRARRGTYFRTREGGGVIPVRSWSLTFHLGMTGYASWTGLGCRTATIAEPTRDEKFWRREIAPWIWLSGYSSLAFNSSFEARF